ncbi:MAG: hypothetical protein K6F56_07130 [Oscillospiraceae bacterium]|nr:hypothetical protein [Oscillospiraceae bacterium]
MKITKRLCLNLILPVCFAVVGVILLYAVSLIPQSAIFPQFRQSALQLSRKSDYVFDNERMAYIMDYNTDASILIESYTLRADEPENVLLNPILMPGTVLQSDAMLAMCDGEAPNVNYVRYWMGFRLLFRPLLLAFAYDSIGWLLSLAFFTLLVLTLAKIGGRLGTRTAACFGLALVLVNPAVAAHSPQFFCCFALSFLMMLYLLRDGRRLPISTCFVCFGILTQFFDFYTTPVMTLGLPLLLCLEQKLFAGKRIRGVLSSLVAWLYGYVGMWLTKLVMTSIFTSEDGLYDGLMSLLGRLEMLPEQGGAAYHAPDALRTVWATVFPGKLLWPTLAVFLAMLLYVVAAYFKTPEKEERELIGAELLTAAIPLVWFSVAAQPTCIHAWFQYRGICVSFCSLFLCLSRAVGLQKRRRGAAR